MKKILSMILVLSMLLSASAALAEGMGVQVIGGPATETEPISLDDIKLEQDAEIPGYAILHPYQYAVQDSLGYYPQGQTTCNWGYTLHFPYYDSGKDAEYVFIRMHITNLSTRSKNFLEQAEVKCIYDDTYEYGGWCYQVNFNNSSYKNKDYGGDSELQNEHWVIDKADQFSIDQMYEGHYVFGCTLPNAVVNSKAPLRLVITIDGNEITYNIRK